MFITPSSPEITGCSVIKGYCVTVTHANLYTVEFLNNELTRKGHSSVVDTMSSDKKLFFFNNELLTNHFQIIPRVSLTRELYCIHNPPFMITVEPVV